MGQEIVQIDAFTSTPFGGNPAAVCLLEAPAEVEWMQAVATEMNLSETCYLVPQHDGYGLRWFTPAQEVKLCGHATLASAHFLYESGIVPRSEPCHFHTLSGDLVAADRGGAIDVSFPAQPPTTCDVPEGLETALGCTVEAFGENVLNYGHVVVDSEATVRGLAPDFVRLYALPHLGYCVTAKGESCDFVSRFFAPRAGINEDPVTGSAHCMLGPYWAEQLGKTEMHAIQASARVGQVDVRVEGDRVVVGGECVTTMRGELV